MNDGKERPLLPSALVDSLVVLDAVFQGLNKTGRPLESAIDALLQRVRSLGYEWRIVPLGTSYDTALEEQFDCFDLVAFGQPVETLEPAVLFHGEPVKRGMLRSVAG